MILCMDFATESIQEGNQEAGQRDGRLNETTHAWNHYIVLLMTITAQARHSHASAIT